MRHHIKVQLLGTIEIEINGTPIKLQRRKAEALLAYLLLNPGLQSREKIAGLMWGDSSTEDARRSLRVTLNDLRKALGDEILPAARDTLSLNDAYDWDVDVLTFSELLDSPASSSTITALSTALKLYRSDLLDGMYDEWITPHREKYRRMMLNALNTLTEQLRAQGEYTSAIECAERLLAFDPYNEKAVQHLLFCFAANGNKELAVKRFKALEKQGNIEFSRETLALYKNIQRETSTSARLTNLPRPLTSFVGREEELNEIETLLTRVRLVTLLGAGGSGKTRLSIQTADETAHLYEGGVWWVDLSPLAEAELVAQSIAKVLGVKERSDQDILPLAAERIGEQRMLLVLDNCEHLIASSAYCVEYLLAHCPQLTVLATSREPLRVEGEAGWQVPTFPLPEADFDPRELQKNEAVQLFLERGRTANHNFLLTQSNTSQVVNICRRLDGIPLAIELAAALLRNLTVEEISKRLDQRFEMLHITDETRVPRQKTLRALIDWSYNLLTNTEQIFFRRLGVFAGGWTFDAAVIVGGGYEADAMQKNFTGGASSAALPINPADIVLGLLDSLRRRSLITVSRDGNTSRYTMLETLREYALEQLAKSNELAELRARHMKHILDFAREADSHLKGKPDMTEWAERLRAELDNTRLALRWGMEEGDLLQAFDLGSAMHRFWGTRGYSEEGREWLHQLVSHPRADKNTRSYALALTHYARSLRSTNRVYQAVPLMDEAITIFARLNDEQDLAYTLFAQGDIYSYTGEFDLAIPPLQQALRYYSQHKEDAFHLANVLSTLGRVALGQKDFPAAERYIEESSSISKEQGDLSTYAWNQLVLGDIAYTQNELSRAREHYEISLELYSTMNRHSNTAYLYEALASLAYWRGEREYAIDLLEKCFQAYSMVKSSGTGFSFSYRASIAQGQGDLAGAEAWLKRSVTPVEELDNLYRSVYLVKLADFASAKADSCAAATLYFLALRLTSDPVTVLFPPDRHHAEAQLDSLRRSMSEVDFESARLQAETLSLKEALHLVFPSL